MLLYKWQVFETEMTTDTAKHRAEREREEERKTDRQIQDSRGLEIV